MRPNPQKTADLVTFTEEILNGKLQFLRSKHYVSVYKNSSNCLDTFNFFICLTTAFISKISLSSLTFSMLKICVLVT